MGLPDNLIRADAAVESTWFQCQGWWRSGGSCYWKCGCGDTLLSPTPSTVTYCDAIATQELAAATDHWGASIRGCYEGWKTWLKNTGTHTYRAGDLWGCMGSWFSGQWHSPASNAYIAKVQSAERNRVWLDPGFGDSNQQAHCAADYGCPA